jgi:chromosome segregation ATPase
VLSNNVRAKEILQANDQLRNANIQKDREIQSLTNDLNIVTQQNKAFSQEIERLSTLGLQMKMGINELKDQSRSANEKERHKDMQLKDIMDAYRKCAEENEVMKKKIDSVKNTETALYENLRNTERELSMVNAEKAAMINKQSLHMEEIGTLE